MEQSSVQTATGSEKISLLEKIGYACSPCTLEMLGNFTTMYLMVFYTNVCGISPAAAGTLLLLCVLWNAINDPLIGYAADNFRFKNGEKMRPYIKLFTIPTGLFLVLLFWMPELNPTAAFFYAFIVFFFYDSFGTAVQMPSMALPMLMSDDTVQRVSTSTWYMIGANVGTILSSVAVASIMRMIGGTAEDGTVLNARAGYRGAVLILVAIMVAGQFTAYFLTKERIRPLKNEIVRIPLMRLLGLLFGEINWVLNTLYALCYVVCLNMLLGTVVYYTTYVLKMPGFEQILTPTVLLASVLMLPLVGIINRRFSRRGILILGAALSIISKIPFIFFSRSLWAVFFNAAFFGMGVTFSIVGMNSNQAEIADIIEWRKGYRIEGSINAFRSLIFKGFTALVPLLLGFLMQASGYIAPTDLVPSPEQNLATQNVFISMFGWMPMITAVLMLVLAIVIPTDRDAAEMRASKARLLQGTPAESAAD